MLNETNTLIVSINVEEHDGEEARMNKIGAREGQG
jgi:hypothetical protein